MECILCGVIIKENDKLVVHKPWRQGLETIIKTAEIRKDSFGLNILAIKEDILNGIIKVKYHKSCRKTYTSKHNIELVSRTGNSSDEVRDIPSSSRTRSNIPTFQIRKMCLICNQSGTKKKQKLTSVQTGTGKCIYEKIINAAKKRDDINMISKLAGFEDLFAHDAKYHRWCYSEYISKYNIQAFINKLKKNKKQAAQDQSCLSNSDETHLDSSNSFMSETRNISVEQIFEQNEYQILHQAAGILKKYMRNFQSPQKDFPAPQDINQTEFQKQVPHILLEFISWLIDDHSYNQLVNNINPQAVIPCNIIMALFNKSYKKNFFHFGLGLYVYHLVRSKQLLDILSQIGVSCTYNDIRQLTTAIAKKRISNKSVYVPPGVKVVDDTIKNYIHASIDNFDLNEDTIDGKNTTHCMAMVVFQQRSENITYIDENLPRKGPYSLNLEDLDFDYGNILKYVNPARRPEPLPLKSFELSRKTDETFTKINVAWKLLQYFKDDSSFLTWSAYNNIISENNVPVTDIFYMPFLNNPPTEFDTIYTSMVRLVELATEIKQPHIVITADLAIYSKAREILWNEPPKLKGKVTLMLGGMHLIMAFIASIGHIFGDGGLAIILTETDVYAENTCKMMLQGKQYSRAIRGITLAADALFRLFLKSLFNCYEHSEIVSNMEYEEDIKKLLVDFQNCIYNKTGIETLLKKIEPLQETMKDFIDKGSITSLTFKYWHSFLDSADLLWRLLQSERNGDFEAHLCAVYDTLPYLAAAGRNLYFKWIPVYLSDMENLKTSIPDMYQFLAKGNFVVKKNSEKTFNCVASDMALEQSINKDCKSFSGVIGFTQKPGTLLRWLTTRHTLGDYSNHFSDLTSTINKRTPFADKSNAVRNENAVIKMVSSLEREWCNPFDLNTVPKELINICTGKIVSGEIEKSLGSFFETAKEKVKNVLHNQTSFWKPMKRDKILTFKDTKVKRKTTSNKIFIGSEFMFRRIICAARFQELDLSNILSYELSSVPPSLFHEDGSMRKTAKSEFLKKIETFTSTLLNCPPVDSYIIDGMVLTQELKSSSFSTFNDFGRLLLNKILINGRKYSAKSITVVFDTYTDQSLKNAERNKRGDTNVVEFKVTGTRKIHNFNEFLKSSSNKRSLLVFLTNYFIQNGSNLLNRDEKLIIAGGFENPKQVFQIICNKEAQNLFPLNSNQEEADTRIILHVLSEVVHSNSILVKSVDTDVLLLLLYYYSITPELEKCFLFIELGHSSNRHFVAIHDVVKNLGPLITKNLLAIHCLSGCDNTSAFYKIGKRTAFDALVKNIECLSELERLPILSEDEAMELASKYVLLLYKNKNNNITDLNGLRLYLTTTSNKPVSELPPTEDAFRQHLKRCIYQLKIWYSSHLADKENEDPAMFGWQLKDKIWIPILTTKDLVPADLRKLLAIKCSDKNCNNSKCVCIKEGLKCSSECRCKCCNNSLSTHDLSDSEDDEA